MYLQIWLVHIKNKRTERLCLQSVNSRTCLKSLQACEARSLFEYLNTFFSGQGWWLRSWLATVLGCLPPETQKLLRYGLQVLQFVFDFLDCTVRNTDCIYGVCNFFPNLDFMFVCYAIRQLALNYSPADKRPKMARLFKIVIKAPKFQ